MPRASPPDDESVPFTEDPGYEYEAIDEEAGSRTTSMTSAV